MLTKILTSVIQSQSKANDYVGQRTVPLPSLVDFYIALWWVMHAPWAGVSFAKFCKMVPPNSVRMYTTAKLTTLDKHDCSQWALLLS